MRSQSALPSQVARLAATRANYALGKSDAIIVVVDAVGYTRQLAVMTLEDRDFLNETMKNSLHPLVTASGGEKISDTGDGSVYRWDVGREEDALYVAMQVSGLELMDGKLRFRVGVASGVITCHYRSTEFSYLGEAINRAARLQSAAEAGVVLSDESVVIPEGMAAGENTHYLIKGQRFSARRLRGRRRSAIFAWLKEGPLFLGPRIITAITRSKTNRGRLELSRRWRLQTEPVHRRLHQS